MKKVMYLMSLAFLPMTSFGQTDKDSVVVEEMDVEIVDGDTTFLQFGNKSVIIYDHQVDVKDDVESCQKKKSKGHWAGVELGFTMLTDGNFGNEFGDHKYWRTDPAKSTTWNFNLFQHKFNVAKHYFGVTTGLGFQYSSIGFTDNYQLNYTPDTLNAFIDTLNSYDKNKLNAWYLSVPLILEFNTKAKANKSFYFGVGVIGSVRIASKTKTKTDEGVKVISKAKYGLQPFKVDGTFRFGYGHFGLFVNYDLIPLFDTSRTIPVHPLTFGLSFNMM